VGFAFFEFLGQSANRGAGSIEVPGRSFRGINGLIPTYQAPRNDENQEMRGFLNTAFFICLEIEKPPSTALNTTRSLG